MFISHKSNVIQSVHEVERQCRRLAKGLTKEEYKVWLDSVTSIVEPVGSEVVDYSGETGYTIVDCTDEEVEARLQQLRDYWTDDSPAVYNIKYYASKRDSEIVDVAAHKDEDGKDVAATYVQTHFIGDDSARDARLLSDEWTLIRKERDGFLTRSDWTQGADSPLASGKKTEWATYRTKLRTLPEDQKDKTTCASITWPSQPS